MDLSSFNPGERSVIPASAVLRMLDELLEVR